MNAGTSSSTRQHTHHWLFAVPSKAERQTLEIDSFHRPNSGTFSLTFTDEYGDEWTQDIPLVVRFPRHSHPTIGNDYSANPGIHKSEISLGDIIRIGNSYSCD